uniref:Transmembrane protein n=1 Tax=Heterorhabditis bacteriophora TaxID=37862 RepID=A0A1I7XTG0_HETBA
MSSVASQRALLLALGSVSIAALFMWYVQSKKSGKKQRRTNNSKSNAQNGMINKSMVRGIADPDDSVKRERNAASEKVAAIASEQTVSSLQTEENVSIVENGVVTTIEEQKTIKEEEVQEEDNREVGYDQSESPGLASQNSELIAPNPPSNCLPCPPFALPQRPAFSSVFTPDCAIYMLFCLRALLGQHCLAWSQVFPVSEPRALSRTSPASSDRCAGQLFYLRFWVRFRLWCVELSVRTDVRMLIRQHHTPEKVDTHQICQVRTTKIELSFRILVLCGTNIHYNTGISSQINFRILILRYVL